MQNYSKNVPGNDKKPLGGNPANLQHHLGAKPPGKKLFPAALTSIIATINVDSPLENCKSWIIIIVDLNKYMKFLQSEWPSSPSPISGESRKAIVVCPEELRASNARNFDISPFTSQILRRCRFAKPANVPPTKSTEYFLSKLFQEF